MDVNYKQMRVGEMRTKIKNKYKLLTMKQAIGAWVKLLIVKMWNYKN